MNKKDVLRYFGNAKYLLLYFYPKDNTPGCTLESKDFSCMKQDFEQLGIKLLGCSKDSEKSHIHFIEKQNLDIELVSDEDLSLHKAFGVWGEKKNYGKTYMGVIRSTFLLDKQGNIMKEWRNVRAKGHAQRVLDYVKEYI